MSHTSVAGLRPAAEEEAISNEGLQVDDLARRFGARWAVARVSFRVPEGGTLMVTGANGSGKTTLLRCLATALAPHHGSATLDGHSLWTERRRLRQQIAFFSHASRLYDDLSGADNLRAWARLGGLPCDAERLLSRVGLPVRRDPVRTYSAGMKRRLALARMLLKRPRLALLDEPFSALDPAGRDLVADVVRELIDNGALLVMATHLPSVAAALCDRSLHMEAGRIVWSGASTSNPLLGGGE